MKSIDKVAVKFFMLHWVMLRSEFYSERRFVLALFGEFLQYMGKYLQQMHKEESK